MYHARGAKIETSPKAMLWLTSPRIPSNRKSIRIHISHPPQHHRTELPIPKTRICLSNSPPNLPPLAHSSILPYVLNTPLDRICIIPSALSLIILPSPLAPCISPPPAQPNLVQSLMKTPITNPPTSSILYYRCSIKSWSGGPQVSSKFLRQGLRARRPLGI